MLRSEGDRLGRVAVSSPGEAFLGIADLAAHNFGQKPDGRLAVDQHDLMKATITAFGAEVVDLPELSGHPNSVFTRDTALSTPEGFVRLRLGLPTREGEDRWMADGLEALGEPMIGEIEAPGTVEGGDVVLVLDAGDTSSIVVTFPADTTIFTEVACLLPGHYEAGMFADVNYTA